MAGAPAPHEYGIKPPSFRLPEGTRPDRVRLQVADLGRSIAYYRNIIGLEIVQQGAATAHLGVRGDSHPLIELSERRDARPVPRAGLLGLYHFALLLPTRAALGGFVRHLVEIGVQFAAADHLVSEATYLWDPDGLGIEVYADRPRHAWRANGRELMMTTERLDLRHVMETAGDTPWEGLAVGTSLGHMHLSVGDLAVAQRFYHDALGFDLTVWSYPGALFLSAGGYHHHLGTNTWAAGARRATDNDARLLEWQLALPSESDRSGANASLQAAGYDVHTGVVTDPWGTALRLALRTTE